MKSILKLSVFVLALTVSCSKEPERMETAGRGLELRLECASPLTKAVGEDLYHENTITHVDCFFYSTASTSASAIYYTRVTGISGATAGNLVATARIILDDTPMEAQGDFWVYVIANLPETPDTTAGTSVEQLRTLATDADFINPSSFVMDSGLERISVGEGLTTATVEVRRLAAKITVETEVEESYKEWRVDENGDSVLVATWTPRLESMQIYLVNGVDHATLDGTPLVRDESSSQYGFNYPLNHTAPFYTYPQTWTFGDTAEPYIKVVLPWSDGQGTLRPFYYKILLPGTDTIERNCWYQLALHISILGSEDDDQETLITGQYHVVDWSESSYTGMDLSKVARYLSTPQRTYTIYSTDTLTIPVTSSHPVEVEVLSARRMDYSQTTPVERDVTANYTGGNDRFSVEAVGKTAVAFRNELDNDPTSSSFDCTPVTFSLRIRHTDGRKSLTVTVVQYPAIYIDAVRSNGYVWVDGQNYDRGNGRTFTTGSIENRYVYANNSTSSTRLGSVSSRNTALSSTGNNNPNQYSLKVSVLPSGSAYTLADVRGAVKNMAPLSGPTRYYPTDMQAGYKISPYFKIASSYGKTTQLNNYAAAEMRCSAYQENGYPAGRWRVPSPGEISFIVNLSSNGVIPSLFDGYYWASDGTKYNSSNGQFVTGNTPSNAVRCVYDLWYWGEGQLDNLTAWGGYHD